MSATPLDNDTGSAWNSKTRDMHRAIISLMEKLEVMDWSACGQPFPGNRPGSGFR
ncbi:MAG: hypothetical protein GY815_18365 [Gammaproteobacteria bacterium]|nr:hypothetical protein [Gammaproteobacteria bacterium]